MSAQAAPAPAPARLYTDAEIAELGVRETRRALSEFVSSGNPGVFQTHGSYFDRLNEHLSACEKAPPRTDFWRKKVLIGDCQNRYNKPNNQEIIPIFNECLKLNTLGCADDDHLTWRGDSLEMLIGEFKLRDYSEDLQASVRKVFPEVERFEFVVRHKATVQDGSKNFKYAEFNTFRGEVAEQIREIELLRLETLGEAKKWAPRLEEVLSDKLVTLVNAQEDEHEPSPKRRRTAESDEEEEETEDGPQAEAQNVSFAGIELRKNLASLQNLRTREFKGDQKAIDAHLVYVMGCLDCLEWRFFDCKYLPTPRAPTFSAGAELALGGDLDDPNDDIECSTAVTQRLVELGLREVYEKMQKSARKLLISIRRLVAIIRSKFLFCIVVRSETAAPTTLAISDLNNVQEYAIGLLYLQAISSSDKKKAEEEADDEEGLAYESGEDSEGSKDSDEDAEISDSDGSDSDGSDSEPESDSEDSDKGSEDSEED